MTTPAAGEPTRDAMDSDDMRAYQEYMLHGAKAKSKNDKTTTNSISSPMGRPRSSRSTGKDATSSSSSSSSPSHKQKQLRLLHRSFHEAVQDWVETDDQLLQVVQSIANLRDRVHVASRALAAAQLDPNKEGSEPPWWTRCGYRPAAPPHPSEHVLQIALSDGLVQHEKMLALLRKLMSQLAQIQDAMGRRLDDLFVMELQIAHGVEDEVVVVESHSPRWKGGHRSGHSSDEATDPVQECVDVHAACSSELYRKQLVAQQLLDSTRNGILHRANDGGIDDADMGDDNGDGDELATRAVPSQERHPRKVARWCARQWSRESKSSELFALRYKLIPHQVHPSSAT